MEICRPRSFRSSDIGMPTSSRPSNVTDPPAMRPGGSIRPRIEKPVTVLPEPDSPTSPMISPGDRSNDTPSTALIAPARVANSVRRSRTERRGAVTGAASD